MRLLPLAILTLLSIFSPGCSSSAPGNEALNTNTVRVEEANANTAKDSVDDLSMVVKLPLEPEEATWKEVTQGQKLIAVLLYSNEDAAKFAASLSSQGQPKSDTVAAEDWFPAELLSQSDIGGESVLKGQSYNAAELLQPPYTEGKVTRIADSNYFVVQLTGK